MPWMSRRSLSLLLLAASAWGQSAILDPLQPTVEMQIYVGSRAPQLPAFSSAAAWTAYANNLRARILNGVVFRGQARQWRDARCGVEWLDTLEGNGYRIRKLRYEAVPGLWIPALLYEPSELSGKRVAVLNLNGHEPNGKAEERWQINCINQAKRGIVSLKPDWIGMGQLKAVAHKEMNQIDLTGSSGVSVFYLSMTRAIDLLVAHKNVDSARIAVTGLSGGGWQTIVVSSLDTRVALSDPVAGYSSFTTKSQMPATDLGDPEQVMTDLATMADYTHLTALVAPRPFLLSNNAKDNCCFRADYAPAPLIAAAAPVWKLLGKPGNFRHYVSFDPGHNYDRGNREAFFSALKRTFFASDPNFSEIEIDVRKELRAPEELMVPLPANNATMNTLALGLIKGLPRAPIANPLEARRKLAALVRDHSYTAIWKEISPDAFQISLDDQWTVPAVVSKPPGASTSTVLMLSDDGRASLADAARKASDGGATVIAIDPLNFGENRIKERNYLWALALSGLGDRMLGLQASQIQAIARTAVKRYPGKLTVEAYGRRASLAALVAAALEPEIVASTRVHGARASLKELIEENVGVDREPDPFCFGLLEFFDIPQLRKLARAGG